MQFRRQGTKFFIKLKLRKIHMFMSQRRFMCIQVQIGCLGYMRVNTSDIFVNHKRRDIV